MNTITDPEMARKAEAVASRLEARVKDGTASDLERARYRQVVDHLLVWDWCQQERRSEAEDPVPPHPVVARFADWWDRNKHKRIWGGGLGWVTAWLYWSAPMDVDEIALLPEVERVLFPESLELAA